MKDDMKNNLKHIDRMEEKHNNIASEYRTLGNKKREKIKKKQLEIEQIQTKKDDKQKQKQLAELQNINYYIEKVNLKQKYLEEASAKRSDKPSKINLRNEMITKLGELDTMKHLGMSAKEVLDEGIKIKNITFFEK